MSTRLSAGRVRATYEFIKAHRHPFSVEAMCHVLEVAPSGYYDGLKQPISKRAQEDARPLRLIRASFVASHRIYGAPRVFLDLREAGKTCSKHRVARLMQLNRRAAANQPCDPESHFVHAVWYANLPGSDATESLQTLGEARAIATGTPLRRGFCIWTR